MTKDELIFLGACAIYAANDAKSYRLALEEAESIHREQHGKGVPNCPNIPPPPPEKNILPQPTPIIDTIGGWASGAPNDRSLYRRVMDGFKRKPNVVYVTMHGGSTVSEEDARKIAARMRANAAHHATRRA